MSRLYPLRRFEDHAYPMRRLFLRPCLLTRIRRWLRQKSFGLL